MSEYLYYEFQAIDRPLTNEEQEELRGISSRASITATGFVNVYNYGDLRASPDSLLVRYFDGFCYVTNWGTRQLMFRIPAHLLDENMVSLYCLDEIFYLERKGDFLLLSFGSETEDYEWAEGEGWLSSMISLRQDLIRGDLRCLYLAWLLGVQQDLVEHGEGEPPVPRGLDNLNSALTSFAEFMRIDQDLIAAGAGGSEAMRPSGQEEETRAWIRELDPAEKDAILFRLMSGNVPQLGNELYQRFLQSRQESGGQPAGQERRTAGDLLDLADTFAHERLEREAREQAIREARQREQQELARKKRLEKMAGREDALWAQVHTLVATRRPRDYDEAVDLLRDLRALAGESGGLEEFGNRFAELVREHQRKFSLMQRLHKTGFDI